MNTEFQSKHAPWTGNSTVTVELDSIIEPEHGQTPVIANETIVTVTVAEPDTVPIEFTNQSEHGQTPAIANETIVTVTVEEPDIIEPIQCTDQQEDRQASVTGEETIVRDTDVQGDSKLPNIQRIDNIIKVVYSAAIWTNVTKSNGSLTQYLEENKKELTQFQTVLFPKDKPIDNLGKLDRKTADHLLCFTTSTLHLLETKQSTERDMACKRIKGYRKKLEKAIPGEEFNKLVENIIEELKIICPAHADIIQTAMTDDGGAFSEFEKEIQHMPCTEPAVTGAKRFTNVTTPEKRGDDKPVVTEHFIKQIQWLFDTKYDTHGKRGFLLILNWNFEGGSKRKGTRKDVEGIQTFFGKELGFTVCIPRLSDKDIDLKLDAHDDHETDDLTVTDLRRVIKKVKKEIENNRNQYYCFVCAIMTHGKREKIFCKNFETFPVQELRENFSNDNFEFEGYPKIFLVQACRGEKFEKFVTRKVSARTDVLAYIDTEHIPFNADLMFAYATTIDYVSHRSAEGGSWFIQACLVIFRAKYKTDHLENMLIDVRRLVSYFYAYDHRNLSNVCKEMPEVVTSLTKQLWFSKSDS